MILPVILIAGTVLAVTSRRKAQQESVARQPHDGTLRPQIVVANDCQAWWIPDTWWTHIAQPKFERMLAAGETNVGTLTYALLDGELASCALPPSLDSSDDPSSEDYWPGPPQMLYLAQHVGEAVADGVTRFLEEGGAPKLMRLQLPSSIPIPEPVPLPAPEAEPVIPPLPPAVAWGMPPDGSIVYPAEADVRDAPYLEDPEDLVFSDDCAVVVIGPEWWDKIGDFVAAYPNETAEDLFAEILGLEFPPDCHYDAAEGARLLRDELWKRITEVKGE